LESGVGSLKDLEFVSISAAYREKFGANLKGCVSIAEYSIQVLRGKDAGPSTEMSSHKVWKEKWIAAASLCLRITIA